MRRSAKVAAKIIKVACVTCYFQPDYVRSRTIRAGLAEVDGVEPIIIKNTVTHSGRFAQVAWAMLVCRFRQKPDIWLLNFRGYELLPLTLLLAGRKPVIYDEFINPVLVTEEHRALKHGLTRSLMGLWKRLAGLYYVLVRRCALVLTDTPAQAVYAARLAGISRTRYAALPVGTDETMFTPAAAPARPRKRFEVFFYGTGSQPLHGVDVIIEAARLLGEDKHIRFTLAGTKGKLADKVAAANNQGANIRHFPWIPFQDMPRHMRRAGICLGGPFGGTQQAQLVITGKTFQMLACGSPVIVGASPATAPEFIDHHNCLVVPQQDPVSLTAAIRWASQHPTELAKIAHRSRRLYDEHFSQRVINDQLAEMVRRVAPR